MTKLCISSGHSKYVRGASGIIDEVDEARKVVDKVADNLRKIGVDVATYHDDVSTTQQENLDRICDWHNAQGAHDLDISVHFNSSVETTSPVGVEVFYMTESDLADDLSSAISACSGLIDRGGKHNDQLYFLNYTEAPALLVETCFVDSVADCDIYHAKFDVICQTIAEIVSGNPTGQPLPLPLVLLHTTGPCSWFGGPNDTGVSSDEGLAFYYVYDDAPHLFLPEQPAGTTGLARRLHPERPYIACRWDYDVTPKTMLADPHHVAYVRATKTGKGAFAWPADWGPHQDTGRVADLSPRLLDLLDIDTDDEVEVIYPAKRK